jgi:hypothetical protein
LVALAASLLPVLPATSNENLLPTAFLEEGLEELLLPPTQR